MQSIIYAALADVPDSDQKKAALDLSAESSVSELRKEAKKQSQKVAAAKTAEDRKRIERELAVTRLALRALEQYGRMEPYYRQYGFPPSRVGDHPDKEPEFKTEGETGGL
ncbi:MAG: uncharacterized protein A8A55_2885 [Amphiamblys sp. WSBS2006]|nr:MAG: uncharacterized protein A8A55_2885 [Amphiamblys sp. WSBS2006]